MIYDPRQFPDNPFDYTALVSHPKEIGKITSGKLGRETKDEIQ